jgi:cation:H+ antiporter
VALDILWALAGLGLLVVAGDALVKGAVNLALRLGIPALVVGLTVVAFGTSAPELLVSVQAAIRDAPGIALGNVVGSNIANILLVIGISALISVIHASQTDTRQSYVTMLAASVLFTALAFTGVFVWWSGLILLAGLGFMLWQSWRAAQAHRLAADPAAEALEEADPQMPLWKILALLSAGLVGLPVGADLLVDASVNIARALDVSETVIGLTLVAVGTSLPELATSVMAAIRRSADVALGNVIGSNVFNLLAIIGVASLIGPIPVAPEFLTRDLWVMLGTSLLLAPFVLRGLDIGRIAGALFVAIFAAYVVVLAVG